LIVGSHVPEVDHFRVRFSQ
jgi:hypothetical protein